MERWNYRLAAYYPSVCGVWRCAVRRDGVR